MFSQIFVTTLETESKEERLIKCYTEESEGWYLPQAVHASSGTNFFPFEDRIVEKKA